MEYNFWALYVACRKELRDIPNIHGFQLSNRPHFPEVCQRNKTTRDVGRTRESL